MKRNDSSVKLISISMPLLCYVLYIIFLSCSDVISLGVYYAGGQDYSLWEAISALVLVCLLAIVLRKRICIKNYQYDFLAYFSLILILVVGIVRSIIPDLSYDTLNGRVFWQFPGFQNNIDYNVFPAGFTFFFPLSDRIFYYPRMILGYRFGTLMNTFLLLLCFAETRALINDLLGASLVTVRDKLLAKCNKQVQYSCVVLFLNESSLALLANMLFYAIANLGTYMIDLTAIPLLIYLLRQLLKEENDIHILQFAFYALLCGLCFALKFPNAILIAPILLCYLLKHKKELNFGYFMVCLIIGVFPAVPYLLYAYTSTGNPVYWTYNSIFKSPYYYDYDFKDERWGPDNLVSMLLWPVRLIFNPTERVSEISKYPQIYILCGFASAIVILCKAIRKKIEDKRYTVLAFIFLVMYALWLVSTGYPRYAIICEILAVVLFGIIACENLKRNKKNLNVITCITLICLVVQSGVNCISGMNNSYDWNWRGTTTDNIENKRLQENISTLLKDRGNIGSDQQHEKVDVFLSMSNTRLFMKLFNEDVQIINAAYIMDYLYGLREEKGIDYESHYKSMLENIYNSGQSVYDIALIGELENVCQNANCWGVEIVDAEYIDNYFDSSTAPLLLQYEQTGVENRYTHIDSTPIEVMNADEILDFHGIIFVHPYAWEECIMEVVSSSNGQERVIAEITLEPGEFCDLSKDIEMPTVTQDEEVSINIINGHMYTYAINLWLD